MKKIWLIVLGVVFVLTTNVYALTWVTSPDNNVAGSPETSLTLGVSDVSKGEWDPAAAGIFGVSAHLGSGFTSHTVTTATALYSWDSYNEDFGYGDVFLMALTEGDYYWNLPITHPVWDDPQLLWPGTLTAWGGDEWDDGILDSAVGSGLETFTVNPSKDYYLNFILDTSNGEDLFPSWGYISDFQIQSTFVPEPATLILIGSGLAGIGLWGRRKGF